LFQRRRDLDPARVIPCTDLALSTQLECSRAHERQRQTRTGKYRCSTARETAQRRGRQRHGRRRLRRRRTTRVHGQKRSQCSVDDFWRGRNSINRGLCNVANLLLAQVTTRDGSTRRRGIAGQELLSIAANRPCTSLLKARRRLGFAWHSEHNAATC